MKIIIEYIDVKKSAKVSRLIKKVLKKAMKVKGIGYTCRVYVGICTDEHIRYINKEHREIDKATDVLSFPMINWEMPCDWDTLKMGEDINPETGEVELGDIIISMETSIAQAKEYNHSIEREISYLALHGLLHLLGYDHINEDDKKLMRLEEEDVLLSLNIIR